MAVSKGDCHAAVELSVADPQRHVQTESQRPIGVESTAPFASPSRPSLAQGPAHLAHAQLGRRSRLPAAPVTEKPCCDASGNCRSIMHFRAVCLID
jgi:hypothetical protein